MAWFWIALLSASMLGLVGILDKALVFHFATSRLTLPLLIGIAQAAIGTALVLVLPWTSAGVGPAGWAMLSGVLWGASVLLVFSVLFEREVSRTMAVFQTYPVFVAPMAVMFLGEDLALYQWAAILAVVSGAVMISIRRDAEHGGLVLDRSLYVLAGASLLAATASIASKVAVDSVDVMQAHGLRVLGMAALLLLVSLRPAPLREIWGFAKRMSPALAIFGLNEFVVANTGMLVSLWAVSLGPVSFVTAVTATSSLFLLAYGFLAALLFRGALGEQMSTASVAIKVLSMALIVAGVVVIAVE